MSMGTIDKVQQKEFPAFDYDATHGKKTDVAVTIVRMDANKLSDCETDLYEGNDANLIAKSKYQYTMTMTTGLISENLPSLGNELIVCEYQTASWEAELQAKHKKEDQINPSDYKELSEVAACHAFEKYARNTYPKDKGIVTRQNVEDLDGKWQNFGYCFFVNKEGVLDKNSRIGRSKVTLGKTKDSMEWIQEQFSAKIGDWVVFEKGNDAYLVKAELK